MEIERSLMIIDLVELKLPVAQGGIYFVAVADDGESDFARCSYGARRKSLLPPSRAGRADLDTFGHHQPFKSFRYSRQFVSRKTLHRGVLLATAHYR